MATIVTDVFLDDGTARTAGELWTLNGGSLTIRTDSRWHIGKPAGMTGAIGAITGSASLGGGVLIDGRNVREVTFNSGSGVVPAIGTLITQGGVTGYLLGVWPNLASAPLTPAAAMPATGFLKFREVTGGAFSAGALTGISANADGPDVPSWIEFVQRQAVANTINRLNFFRVRGTWYTLPQVTSGAANQTIQVPTNGGGAGTEVPAIWIETGVGTNEYESFPCLVAAQFIPANLGTDARSKFCQTLGNGQVRIGSDGTNNVGFVPPAGCRIIIPNVLGRQTTSANDALNLVPNTTLASRPDYTTTSNGVIDLEYFMSDSYFLFATPNNVIIKNCATFDILSTSNEAQPCDIDNLVISPYNTSGSSLVFANNPNGGVIKNLKFFRRDAASNGHVGSIILCANYEFENVHCGVLTYARSTGRSIFLSQVQDTLFKDFYQYNAFLSLGTCARVNFEGLDHNDRFVGNTNSTTGMNLVSFSASCDSCEIDGFTFGLKGLVTDFCNPYSALVLSNACSNIKIKNGGTITNKLRVASAALAPQYIIQDSGGTNGLRAQRIYLQFTRTSDLVAQNSAKGIILENCQGTDGGTGIGSSLSTIKGSRRGTQPNTGSPAVVGTHFMDFFQNDTQGVVTFLANEPTAETASIVTTNLTTGAGGFNAAGQFVMPAIGDQIIIESPYFIKGHTGFRNNAIARTGANADNMSYEYDIDTGSGYTGVWKLTTQVSPFPQFPEVISETGFKIKIRITTITANPANAITVVSFLTTSTFNAQRDNLYPLDLVNINLTGLVPNSRVQLYDTTNSVELFNQIVTGTSLNFETEYAADFNLRTRVTYATDTDARIFFEDTDLITVAGLTKNISQEVDDAYVANGIDGFTVTDIDIIDALMLVEIDTATLPWPTLYAFTVAWNYSEEGIRDEGVFVEALDQANYLVNGFQIKNVSSPSVPLTLTNGWGRDAVTNTTAAIIDNTGGSIFSNPDLVVPFASGSGLSPTQDAILSQIGSRTEKVDGMIENTGTYDRFKAEALEESPAGGGGGGSYDDTVLIAKIDVIDSNVDAIKAKTDTLVNTNLTGIATSANVTAAQAAIIAEVNAIANVVSDKTGYALTPAERTAIAVAVEQAILNDGDGQAILNAIVGAIGNQNIDEIALVAAIRADLERAGGDIKLIKAKTDTLVNADLSPVLSAIAALNNLSAAQVLTQVTNALNTYDGPTSAEINANQAALLTAIGSGGVTAAEIYSFFTASNRADAFKADLTAVLTAIAATSTSAELAAQTVDLLAAIGTGGVSEAQMYDFFTTMGRADAFKADLTLVAKTAELAQTELDIVQAIDNIAIDLSPVETQLDAIEQKIDDGFTDVIDAVENKVISRNDEISGQVQQSGSLVGIIEQNEIIGGL